MLELRIKANSVKELHDLIAFFKSNPFASYIFKDFSKVYVMKNGQYKFFVDCIDFKTYKALQMLNLSNESVEFSKKRGRKPKTRQTL